MKTRNSFLPVPRFPTNQRWCPGLAAFALCAITLVAWTSSFQSGFVFDNRPLLLGDTYWLSFLFNYAILGNADRPAGYHWVNLLLHTGNVLLVFALARSRQNESSYSQSSSER